MSMVASIEPQTERHLYLEDNFPKSRGYTVSDTRRGIEYKLNVSSRRLGEDTGKDVFVDWGSQLDRLIENFAANLKNAPKEMKLQVAKAIKEITLGHDRFPF